MKRAREESLEEETLPNTLRVHNGSFLSTVQKQALLQTASALATPGKGITACDESAGTIGKRFEEVGVENTEENRRTYRQMLFEGVNLSLFLFLSSPRYTILIYDIYPQCMGQPKLHPTQVFLEKLVTFFLVQFLTQRH